MTAAARTLALVAVIAALVLSATPATASAGVGGTLCSVAGWLSGVAGKVCSVASNAGRVLNAGKKLAGGHIGGAIGALTGGASKTVARAAGIAAVAAGVIAGAEYALKLTVKAIGSSTNPDLGAVWFSASYWRMAAVSALLTVPFLLAAALQSMLRSDLTLLLRAAFGYLPLGLLAVGIAAPVTALLLAGSDEMSSIVSSASGHAGESFLGHVGGLSAVISGLSGSVFVSFFIALFTIAAAITLWLELLIRQAAVYVIVLMLPLFFAAMVWPARRIWAVRAVELLVALILSKFAIVAVLGLGGAALGHTLLPGPGSLLAGTTLVLLAAFSPWALLRLLPLHELAGAAVGGLRPHAAAPPRVAGARAEGATDAADDATGGGAAENGAAGADAASEEVAADLPARLRTFAQWAGEAGGGGTGAAAERAAGERAGVGGESAGVGGESAGVGGGGTPERGGGSGSTATAPEEEHAAPAPTTNGHVGSPAVTGSDVAPTEIAVPDMDAFGSTVRHGELPAVFQNMSLDADVLHLGPPADDATEGRPDTSLPALPHPPAAPGPEDEAE